MRNLQQLFDWQYIGQIIGGDFANFCGLLRIHELYGNFCSLFLPLDQKDSKTHHHYPTHQAAHTQLIVRHRVVKKTNRGSKNRVVIVQEICVCLL